MKLYDALAPWWPLFSPPEDYEEEAAFYVEAIKSAHPKASTLLELGAGGGNNAFHMKSHFTLTLSDPAPGMLAHSRALNPEAEHHVGDMRTLRLDRTFDGIFIQDAISYLTTLEDLDRTFETIKTHLGPDGVCLIAPDALLETYTPSTDHGGSDDPEADRGIRFLEWCHPTEPGGRTVTVDYFVMMREGKDVTVVQDRHIEGLFSEAEWREAGRKVGLELRLLDWEHSELPPGSYKGLLFTQAP